MKKYLVVLVLICLIFNSCKTTSPMLGAYHLINNAELSLDDLIKAVASKGGTTEAALKTFGEQNVDKGIIEGIINAESRAKELSK